MSQVIKTNHSSVQNDSNFLMILKTVWSMMKVLRILEGDMIVDGNYGSTPGSDAGNRSGRFWAEHYSGQLTKDGYGSGRFSERMSVETPRLALRERERGQRLELNHNKQ